MEVVRCGNKVMSGKNLSVIAKYAKKADIVNVNLDMPNSTLQVFYADGAEFKTEFADRMVMLEFATKKFNRGMFPKLSFEHRLNAEEVSLAAWRVIHDGNCDQEEEDKMVSNIVYNQMNSMRGDSGKRKEFLPNRMAYEHNTIQQNFMKLVILPFITLEAEKTSFIDLRNQGTVDLCKFIKKSIDNENMRRRDVNKPDIDYLPFI